MTLLEAKAETDRIGMILVQTPMRRRARVLNRELSGVPTELASIIMVSGALKALTMPVKRIDWERISVFSSGAALFLVMLGVAIFIPQPSPFQYKVFGVILAFAAGSFGALLPGLFKITSNKLMGFGIRATGAAGMVVFVYLVNPVSVPSEQRPSIQQMTNSLHSSGLMNAAFVRTFRPSI